MLLSSALPPIGSWHSLSGGEPAPILAASLPGPSQISSFYPYVVSPREYPTAGSIPRSSISNVSVLEASAGCSGPTALTLGIAVNGVLPPDGCALYTLSISQSTWSSDVGKYLGARETDLAVNGEQPVFALYQSVGTTPSPSNWLEYATGPNAATTVTLTSSAASSNIQGGWGTYEYAVVAGASSYGGYCFGVYLSATTECATALIARIGVAQGASTLSVNFSAVLCGAACTPAVTYSWTFGDGSTSTAADPTHSYASSGSYVVTLSVHSTTPYLFSNSSLQIGVGAATAPCPPSFPHVASVVIGSTPTFLLAYSAIGASNVSDLLFSTASYNSSLAASLAVNGTAGIPLAWKEPATVVAAFPSAISGDAIAVNPSGSTIALAASAGGTTWVYDSANGGISWTSLTPGGVAGSNPDLALNAYNLLTATWLPSTSPVEVVATTLSLLGYGSPQVDLVYDGSSAADFATVAAAGIASGPLGVAITTSNGFVAYFRSTDNGHEYSPSVIGTFATSSSSVFESIGNTRLADPAAAPGSITAVAQSSNVFVLYTALNDGRAVANITVSGDGGLEWSPTELYELPVGSIGEPDAAASATGYVYVTWTDDSQGPVSVDQAVFGSDGRLIQNATAIPGSTGTTTISASFPSVAVDSLMRPLYAWVRALGSSTTTLVDSGAFLTPANALGLVNSSYCQLTIWDLKPGSGTSPCSTSSSFNVASGELRAALPDPSECGSAKEPTTAQTAAARVYGNVTHFAFVYVNTTASECANIVPATVPISNVTGYGPTAAGTYLSVEGDWVLESLGVEAGYGGDALASVLTSAAAASPANSTLPPVKGTTQTSTASVYGDSADAVVTAVPLNPTTGALNSSVSFPTLVALNSHSVVCGVNGNDKPIYEDWVNNSETAYYSWTVTVEGISHTFSSTVSVGSAWNLPSKIYLTNLTPDAGVSWSTGAFTAQYDQVEVFGSACDPAEDYTHVIGADGTYTIPGVSGTLYTELALAPSTPSGTLLQISPAQPPYPVGNGTGGVEDGSSGVSATLSTSKPYDLIVAFVVLGSYADVPTGISCSDTDGLSWSTRAAVNPTSSTTNPGAYEVYAYSSGQLTSDTITCTPNSGASNLAMVVFGVKSDSFDNALGLPATETIQQGTGGTPSLTVDTNESNDLILGMLGCGYYDYNSGSDPTAVGGFRPVATVYEPPTAFVEYEEGASAGPNTVTTSSEPCEGAQKFGMTFIGDAISGGYSNVSAAWGNTLPAQGAASYTNTIGWAGSESNSNWSTYDSFNFSELPTGAASGSSSVDYTFDMSATSQAGNWNATQQPAISAGEVFSASPLTASQSCTFPLQPDDVEIAGPPHVITNLTSNKATVNWSSNADGPAWLQYYELGVGLNWSQTASIKPSGSSKYPYNYTVELQGITPLALFGLTAWSSYIAIPGCVSYTSTSSTVFLAPGAFGLTEWDHPYDSITEEGGGASIEWTVSPGLVAYGTLTNGTLFYTPKGSSTVIAPIGTSVGLTLSGSADVYNVTLPTLNTTYTVWVELNYSVDWKQVAGEFSVTSTPLTFTYQRDSSGDSLTDLEKILGWTVPVTGLSGTTTDEWVAANPQSYATNGLVSDYIEKQFDLNPNTVDTAGSHMLDTWNLTFSIGNASLPANSNFVIWYENSTYHPFARTVAYSPGEFEKGYPNATNLPNISANSAHGITSGDGGSWAAEALWSYSALSTFVNLSGVRAADSLRAVEGIWNGTKTLTVWGKLSWAADPLAASTPSNGIADGQRINPATGVALSATISNLYVTGLTTGQGYAAMFRPYSGPTVTGTPEFTNYSAPVGLGTGSGNGGSGSIARLTGYTVVLPVSQTSQYQTIQLEVLANEHGTSTLNHIAFDSGAEAVNLTYDMVAGTWLNESFSSNKVNGTNGSLSVQFKEVSIGGKATTYLWLPTNNGTTNGLPAGLERYIGEQSFDLVALNSSSSWSSAAIPYPWGGNYTVTVHPGLNNLLLPRAQFLNSSFAAAVLEGKEFPYPSSHPTPAILAQDTTAQGILTSAFGTSSGLMFDLEAYWQNRAIALGSSGNFTSAENGTSSNSYLQVRVVAVSSAVSNNTGGLASDPAVYSTSDPAPPALQAIVTLNITSSATLDLLLAALLDNTTGVWDGVNGTFASITSQVASIGFDGSVLSALANQPIVSEGLYGPPPYKPSSHPSGGLWGDFWNAVSAVVTNLAGAIFALVGEVWSLTLAVATFLDHIAIEAARIGGTLLSMSAAVLVSAGKVILSALSELLDYVIAWVKAALAEILNPLVRCVEAFDASVAGAANATISDVENGGTVTSAHAAALMKALSGTVAVFALILGVVAEVVLTLLTPFDEGPTLVVALILAVVTVTTAVLFSSVSGTAALSAQAVWNVDTFVNSSEPANKGTSPQVDWRALAESVSVAAATSDTMLSVVLGSMTKSGYTLPLAALVMDLIALVIDWVTWATSLGDLIVISAVAGLFALVLSYLGLRTASSAQVRILNYLDVGLATVAFGAALGDIALIF